jgi:hypothetical protein
MHGDNMASFVQIRGSIPVFWSQLPNISYKPPPTITGAPADSSEAFRKHFDEQRELYGPLVCISLIDHKGKELLLAREYAEQVETYNCPDLKYIAFDFHKECKKGSARIAVLIDKVIPDVDKFGYFLVNNSTGVVQRRQLGSFRTNCVDNLDRTNVVQGRIASKCLERQLFTLGVFADPTDCVAMYRGFDLLFKNMWANNADCISTQYSGTRALKNDITRTGKRTIAGLKDDGTNSMHRYWLNNFSDGSKQDSYNLFLGNYVPSRDVLSPFTPPPAKTLALALVVALVVCLVTFMAALLTPGIARNPRLAIAIACLLEVFVLYRIAVRNGRSLVNNPVLGLSPQVAAASSSVSKKFD